MTAARHSLGRRGEQVVATGLARAGWLILERNARPPGARGELDIVARHGRDLVFVEVKTARAGTSAGPRNPVEMVDPRKRARLRRLAGAWLAAHPEAAPRGGGIRIDVVALRLDARGRVVEQTHLRGAC